MPLSDVGPVGAALRERERGERLLAPHLVESRRCATSMQHATATGMIPAAQ
ncbi:hypothetical protein ACFWV1_28795 [Streptomyces sp. NPDC058700]|uniref:hypothetical protein n=1 Tax=unclassified Streptomyces TaxID=2593676 RepID=UPI003666D88F